MAELRRGAGGVGEKELARWVNDRTEDDRRRVKGIKIVDRLPTNNNGKKMRGRMKEMWRELERS